VAIPKNGDFLYLTLCNLLILFQLEHIHQIHKIVGLKPISPTNHGRRHSIKHIYYYPLAEPESDIVGTYGQGYLLLGCPDP
jgi:hypothetical protein